MTELNGVVKKLSAKCRFDVRHAGSIPGSGRSLGEGMQSIPVFLPGESHGQRSLAHRVTQSRRRLSDLAQHNRFIILFTQIIYKTQTHKIKKTFLVSQYSALKSTAVLYKSWHTGAGLERAGKKS